MAGVDAARLRRLQALGILSGVTAGAWLGAAEAPTKLVTLGIPPVAISFVMVMGVFLARWSLPALLRGTAGVHADLARTPHLVVWALLAGGLWAIANTLTVHAIRDVGLAIAFPLWNANGLLGIVWGALLFGELRGAGALRWLGVCGGAAVLFAGAVVLGLASVEQAPPAAALRGVAAALGAGLLWGTMYIPCRKAHLTRKFKSGGARSGHESALLPGVLHAGRARDHGRPRGRGARRARGRVADPRVLRSPCTSLLGRGASLILEHDFPVPGSREVPSTWSTTGLTALRGSSGLPEFGRFPCIFPGDQGPWPPKTGSHQTACSAT